MFLYTSTHSCLSLPYFYLNIDLITQQCVTIYICMCSWQRQILGAIYEHTVLWLIYNSQHRPIQNNKNNIIFGIVCQSLEKVCGAQST